jgi:YD repeat-containing protein
MSILLYKLSEKLVWCPHDLPYAWNPENRLTAAGIIAQWVYNENNELEQAGGTTFSYNANGSTVTKSRNGTTEQRYIYNPENRLSEVKDGNGNKTAAYGYDPFGRRIWKEVNSVRTYYLYSDEGLAGEYDATGNEIKRYGWRPNTPWSTDPLFMEEGGEYYWCQRRCYKAPK